MADDSREVEATSQAQEATEEAGAGSVRDCEDLKFLRFLERYAPETMRSWRSTYERFGKEHVEKIKG